MLEEDDIVIEDIDELVSLLARAYWIEDQFEQMTLWDTYTSIGEKYRDIVFRLAHDSEKHKIKLKKLISNISGIDLKTITNYTKARQNVGLNRSLLSEEILGEIKKHDILALELYTRIYKHTAKELLDEIWEGERHDEFYEILAHLMRDEAKHIKIVEPYVGKLQRIR